VKPPTRRVYHQKKEAKLISSVNIRGADVLHLQGSFLLNLICYIMEIYLAVLESRKIQDYICYSKKKCARSYKQYYEK
jgi:hypothetical protein